VNATSVAVSADAIFRRLLARPNVADTNGRNHGRTVLAKASSLCALAICAVAGALVAPQSASAGSGCAAAVINDWRDGRLDGIYAPGCYRQALRELPEDIRIYSSAETDIHRALMASLTTKGTRKIGGVKGVTRTLASTKPTAATQRKAAQAVLAADATKMPLAVILAGVLAVVLLGAASVSVLARKLRA
jgi:hypothetical protein